MGRGASQGPSLLYGKPETRYRTPKRFVVVSGMQLPGAEARPARGLDAWVVIGSLADNCRDDSASEMLFHLTEATMPKFRYSVDGYKVVSDDLRRDKVVAAFEKVRRQDPGLHNWDFDEIQWDICMRGLSLAHRSGGFDGASAEEIATTYKRLCGVGIEDRGDSVLCACCRRVIRYDGSVSGEAWRPDFGNCGYLCGRKDCLM